MAMEDFHNALKERLETIVTFQQERESSLRDINQLTFDQVS